MPHDPHEAAFCTRHANLCASYAILWGSLSVAIVLAFVYLTRPAAGFGYDVLHPRAEDVGLLLTSSFGARALFGYFCGALTVFYNLAVDFNKPFDGAFTLESGTLTATLRQMRDRVDVYIDT